MIRYIDTNGDSAEAVYFCPRCCRPDELRALATVTFPVDPNSGAWADSSPNDHDMDDLDENSTVTCNRCEWTGVLQDFELDTSDEHLLAPRGLLEDLEAIVEALWPETEGITLIDPLKTQVKRVNLWLGGGELK